MTVLLACVVAGLLMLRGLLIGVLMPRVLNAYQASALGTLTGLAILLIFPAACRWATRYAGGSPKAEEITSRIGIAFSFLLLFPVLILFME